jgi:hypothetical protein
LDNNLPLYQLENGNLCFWFLGFSWTLDALECPKIPKFGENLAIFVAISHFLNIGKPDISLKICFKAEKWPLRPREDPDPRQDPSAGRDIGQVGSSPLQILAIVAKIVKISRVVKVTENPVISLFFSSFCLFFEAICGENESVR